MDEDAPTDQLQATRVIEASMADVFAALADPATHATLDGTGWVLGAVDVAPLVSVGQRFTMAMYHPNHPDGEYETINEVRELDAPHVIGWATGYREPSDGSVRFGGWTWRYDLAEIEPDRARVTLTYDWSAVSTEVRERIGFPPFGVDHLASSLEHLADLVTAAP